MDKISYYGQDVRDGLISGVNKLVDPVRITLGAKGKVVGIYDSRIGKGSHVTKDGFIIAKNISVDSNKLEALAIDIVNQAIEKTNDDVGDATTTTAIIAQYLINKGLKNISNDTDPLKLKEGINLGLKFAVKEIEKVSIPVKDKIEEIATISGNNDRDIGRIIAEAFKFAGEHEQSSIKIIPTTDNKTSVQEISGYKLQKGFLRDTFINDKSNKCIYNNPYIIMIHAPLSSFRDFMPLLEKVSEEQRPLVIIADKFEGEFLNSLEVSNASQAQQMKQGRIGYFQHIGIVQNPMAMDSARELYDDMGDIMDYKGSAFSVIINDVVLEDLGEAESVEISRTHTLIIGGKGSKGDQKKIKKKIDKLKSQLDNDKELSDWQKGVLRTRIESLSGSHANIRVGEQVIADMKETKDLYDDALSAVRASIKEGITAGGGSELLRIAHKMRSKVPKDLDIARGWIIFVDALESPFYQIMENAGESGDVIKRDILESRIANCGYNVLTREYVDMIKEGIIDPAMAERVSLENAVSVAGLMYNMDAVVLEDLS